MHDVSALLIEAVANSVEAGAERTDIRVEISDGIVNARIEDDGVYTIKGDPFQDGNTTKGEGRGRGLHIIKERSRGRCRLTRGDGITVLEFTADDDGSFADLSEALLPVLGMDESITVTIRKDGRETAVTRKLLEERDAVPDSATGIRRFRELLSGLEKEKSMAKLSLSDLHEIRNREEKNLKKRDIHGRDIHVVVAMGTSGIDAGAKLTLNTIADEVERLGLDNVIITQTGSAAPNPEPVVEVYTPKTGLVVYGSVDKEAAVRIVNEHLKDGRVLSDLRIELVEKE